MLHKTGHKCPQSTNRGTASYVRLHKRAHFTDMISHVNLPLFTSRSVDLITPAHRLSSWLNCVSLSSLHCYTAQLFHTDLRLSFVQKCIKCLSSGWRNSEHELRDLDDVNIFIESRGRESIYYHGPHELCIIAGGPQKFYLYLTMRKSDFSWLTTEVPAYHGASFWRDFVFLLGSGNSDEGHIKCSRGPQGPYPWFRARISIRGNPHNGEFCTCTDKNYVLGTPRRM